jgi:hypothetical protein
MLLKEQKEDATSVEAQADSNSRWKRVTELFSTSLHQFKERDSKARDHCRALSRHRRTTIG